MLKINNLQVSYDGIQALRGVSLNVAQGEMVALIGPNGAGKSTLLNALSGFLRQKRGEVVFDGRTIGNLPPHRVSHLGLLHVPEGRQILVELSVLENLQLGEIALGSRPRRYGLDDVYAIFPLLAERSQQNAGSLSGGQQQMLAIGRALMGAPTLLLLDEPSLGLSPQMSQQVFAAIRKLNQDGTTVLVVEQNAQLALSASNRAYVIEGGRIVQEGQSQELLGDPRVIAHYLGQDVDA